MPTIEYSTDPGQGSASAQSCILGSSWPGLPEVGDAMSHTSGRTNFNILGRQYLEFVFGVCIYGQHHDWKAVSNKCFEFMKGFHVGHVGSCTNHLLCPRLTPTSHRFLGSQPYLGMWATSIISFSPPTKIWQIQKPCLLGNFAALAHGLVKSKLVFHCSCGSFSVYVALKYGSNRSG